MNAYLLLALLFVGVIGLCLAITLPIQIWKGKALDPNVKTLTQANRAIKLGQKIYSMKTGYWTNNYFELKSFLKENGLLPLNSKPVKKVFNQSNKEEIPNFGQDSDEYKTLAKYCQENKIPTPSYGPDLNFCKEDKYCQDVKPLVERLFAMFIIDHLAACFQEGANVMQVKKECERIISSLKIQNSLSEDEQAFLKNPTIEMAQHLSWQVENSLTLAWALSLTDKILPSSALVPNDLNDIFGKIAKYKTVEETLKHVKLRPENELKFWANVYYCCLWAYRQQNFDPKVKLPKKINGQTVENRYHSLAWILFNENEFDDDGNKTNLPPKRYDWDDTPLDT